MTRWRPAKITRLTDNHGALDKPQPYDWDVPYIGNWKKDYYYQAHLKLHTVSIYLGRPFNTLMTHLLRRRRHSCSKLATGRRLWHHMGVENLHRVLCHGQRMMCGHLQWRYNSFPFSLFHYFPQKNDECLKKKDLSREVSKKK